MTIAELHALHDPKLREVEGGMVTEIWEDGEVTSQKCGSLYRQRNLHLIVPGLPGVNIALPDMRKSGHSCMAVTDENMRKARAAMAALAGVEDPYKDCLPGAKGGGAENVMKEINERNTLAAEQGLI